MPGACLHFEPTFLMPEQADHALRELLQHTRWRQEEVFVWGRWRRQPRLTAWYGDDGTRYTYSGRTLEPLPWTALLAGLRARIEQRTGTTYNSVLLNLYRDHDDSIGWHADDEPELGTEPTIASLSLGETRVLLFRHRRDSSLGIRHIALPHGSLLVMSGATQANWLHAINKQRRRCGSRINLTFRFVGQRRPL
jgi:alkylated DNA repair dioxygenase AlkB